MASFVTNRGARDLSASTSGTQIVWGTDTIRARLVASSFTPTKDDTSMTGYTAIGTDQALGTKTFTEDTTNDRIVYDAADSTWTAVAGGSTVGWIVIFKFVTNDAGSTPIAVIDVADTATNGGDITATYASTGIFYLQQ
jgi:hypothetical protein